MKSMTGFGKSSSESKDCAIDVTVKAVNGRFLDVKIFGPKIYSSLEIDIRKRLSKKLLRGTVEVFINRKSFGATEKIHFNDKLAEQWLKGFQKVSKKLKMDEVNDSRILLNVPEFFKIDETNSLSSKEKTLLYKTLDKAVESCGQVRGKEGDGLKKDLSQHINNLNKKLSLIKKQRDQAAKALKEKYLLRLEKLGFPGEIDEQRLAQEVVIHIDKSDISEEIQRLGAHIEAIKKLIQQPGSIGKKLDFYAQELLREVNTIGSKSSNAGLTQVVVDAKAIVEKYREQVQNVE
ncbi:MAG: YicC family protein [Bdellovibrionales bacterium]|nr:YicC family protein [Bdellovibrionales bacterium]NQZ18982.1 YicC family protein [Bdellovibrionales bacterium]